MWLNRGRFRDNGNCGYLLRPPFHQPGFENKLEKRRRAAEESAEFSLLSQREVLKLAKEEAKRERKQAKLDAIAAKKQAKEDKRAAKEAKKQAKRDTCKVDYRLTHRDLPLYSETLSIISEYSLLMRLLT